MILAFMIILAVRPFILFLFIIISRKFKRFIACFSVFVGSEFIVSCTPRILDSSCGSLIFSMNWPPILRSVLLGKSSCTFSLFVRIQVFEMPIFISFSVRNSVIMSSCFCRSVIVSAIGWRSSAKAGALSLNVSPIWIPVVLFSSSLSSGS